MGIGISRRRFLRALGAGAFLTLMGGCGSSKHAPKLGSLRTPKASPLRASKVWPLPGVSPVRPKGVWAFRSRPDLAPAAAEVTGDVSGTGYVFLALKEGVGEHGPMILDDRGRLVWFEKYVTARNFKVQRYRGRPVLTWWEGSVVAGHGGVEYGATWEGIAQEVDIETGEVLFEWHSLDHVGVEASHVHTPADPDFVYDYFHINSIDVDHDDNLLISARNTSAVYKV